MDALDNLNLTTCSIDMGFAPKDHDRAVHLLLSVAGAIRAKRGCRTCRVGMEAAEEGQVHYQEEWDSEDAFRRHVESAQFRPVFVAMEMCTEAPRVVIGMLSGQCGLEYLRLLRESGGAPAE